MFRNQIKQDKRHVFFFLLFSPYFQQDWTHLARTFKLISFFFCNIFFQLSYYIVYSHLFSPVYVADKWVCWLCIWWDLWITTGTHLQSLSSFVKGVYLTLYCSGTCLESCFSLHTNKYCVANNCLARVFLLLLLLLQAYNIKYSIVIYLDGHSWHSD